jgi:heme A synthase
MPLSVRIGLMVVSGGALVALVLLCVLALARGSNRTASGRLRIHRHVFGLMGLIVMTAMAAVIGEWSLHLVPMLVGPVLVYLVARVSLAYCPKCLRAVSPEALWRPARHCSRCGERTVVR